MLRHMKFENLCSFIYITIFTLLFLAVESRRYSPLLVEDDGIRKNSRSTVSECQFGKTFRELGSTWFADLGPPFGVMYCIKCECVAVPKKRRIVGRVQCRNIKNECPQANCEDPVLLPGKCCKVCATENDSTILLDHPIQSLSEDEDRHVKYFAAFLNGKTSQLLRREEMKTMYTTNNPQNIIATARFTFHKKNLYYSFYVSQKISRPRFIQFIDDSGLILEEHNVLLSASGRLSLYQNQTGKVCGVWRRVPRDYKRLLREERMHVVLIWSGKYQSELALAGRVIRYAPLSTELFSSLLEPGPGAKPDQMFGAGGTAVVTINSSAASSIHLMIIFNGLFRVEEVTETLINVRMEVTEKKEVILNEIQKVKKPSSDINVLEISSPISMQNLRLLSRGKLSLVVESKKYPALKIQGQIITRVTCELFQSLLTSDSLDFATRVSGLAWVYLNTDGSLVYNIQTDSLDLSKHPEICLVEDNGKKRVIFEDLTRTFNYDQAIGVIDRLSPKVLESLYSENLAVNIGIINEPYLLKGRLLPHPIADATDSFEPILLKHTDINRTAYLVGMAWLSVDNDCNLHYELFINGIFDTEQTFQIYLEEKPIEVFGAPVTKTFLDEFSGAHKEGFVIGMALSELVKLETSVCYLEVYSKNTNEILLRGKLKSTKVPSHCFPHYTDNNVRSVIVSSQYGDSHFLEAETKCFHSGRFYDEAEQWKSKQDACTMCTCQYGQISCDIIKCPNSICENGEEHIIRQGECCPSCLSPKIIIETNNSAERGCNLGDQFHLAGATWHPYLPPNGFDTCATCTCDPFSLKIHCLRITCPPLVCPDDIAFRPDKKACCKICPEVKLNSYRNKTSTNNSNVLQDQEISRQVFQSAEELLAQGGCKALNTVYENGQEWHPVLVSHGEQKCVKCRCKDSVVTCDRKRCTRSVCDNRLTVRESEILNVDTDECCKLHKCRRWRRHHNHRHFRYRNHKVSVSKLTSSNSDQR